MRKTLRLFAFVSFTVGLAPGAIHNFYTPLAPEVSGAAGTGFSRFSFDDIGQTLSMEFWWSGLSGVTTVSHIHCCTPDPGMGTVGVAVTPGTLPGFPTGLSAGSYSIDLDLTMETTYTTGFRGTDSPADASARLLQGIYDGRAYLNIHSNAFPGGEIRGFLAPVPEPATFGFAAGALTLLAVSRRFRFR